MERDRRACIIESPDSNIRSRRQAIPDAQHRRSDGNAKQARQQPREQAFLARTRETEDPKLMHYKKEPPGTDPHRRMGHYAVLNSDGRLAAHSANGCASNLIIANFPPASTPKAAMAGPVPESINSWGEGLAGGNPAYGKAAYSVAPR
jgi:hypothetical protein